MSRPLVSVLLSTYNRLDLLKICLNSILSQNYANLDIIIFNDCSNDGTKEYLGTINDKRLNIFNSPKNIVQKHGHTKVWLKMLEMSAGNLIINISDDDYWPYHGFIDECVNKFQEFNNLSKVIGNQVDYNYQDGKFKEFNYKEIQERINFKDELVYHDNMIKGGFYKSLNYLKEFSKRPLDLNISTSGTMFHKKKFLEVNALLSDKLSKYQGGYELLIPSSFFGDIYFIDKPRVVVGLNSKNLSFNKTQIEHLDDSILSVSNALNTVKKHKKSEFLIEEIKNFEKDILSSIINTYLSHSILILRNKKLSLCTNENIQGYLNLRLYIKYIRKYKCKPKIEYILSYIVEKFIPNYLTKIYYTFYSLFKRLINRIIRI